MDVGNAAGNGLLFAAFNQDQGCFAAGLDDGFRIYNCDPLKQKEREDFAEGGIGQVEMLFRCNYLALVGGGRNPKFPRNKVAIWDDVRKEAVITLELASDVKVFSFTTNPQQLHVYETAPNPLGLCCLCPASTRSLVGFPGRGFGDVQLVDLGATDRAPLLIDAHEAALAALALNADGSLLATASAKGTLIRIFDTEEGAKLLELRRGAQPAVIHCLNFSQDSSQLCVSSDHGTVHVFALQADKSKSNNKLVPKYFRSLTSMCQVKLPSAGKKSMGPAICAFGADPGSLIVVCADGSYFKFAFTAKGEVKRLNYAMFLEMTD